MGKTCIEIINEQRDCLFNLTAEQKIAWISAMVDLLDRYVKIRQELKFIRSCIVPLPHTNENGKPVLHGANKMMYNLEDYYLSEIRNIRWMVNRDLRITWLKENGIEPENFDY